MPVINLQGIDFAGLLDSFTPKGMAQAQALGASTAHQQMLNEQLAERRAAAKARAAAAVERINMDQPPTSDFNMPSMPDFMPDAKGEKWGMRSMIDPATNAPLDTVRAPMAWTNPEGVKKFEADRTVRTTGVEQLSLLDHPELVIPEMARGQVMQSGAPTDAAGINQLNFMTGTQLPAATSGLSNPFKDKGTEAAALTELNGMVEQTGGLPGEQHKRLAAALFERAAGNLELTPNLMPLVKYLQQEKRIGGYIQPEEGAAPVAAAAAAAPAQAASPLPAPVKAAPAPAPSPTVAAGVAAAMQPPSPLTQAPLPPAAGAAPGPAAPAPVPTTPAAAAAAQPAAVKINPRTGKPNTALDDVDDAIAEAAKALAAAPQQGGATGILFGGSPQAKMAQDIREKILTNKNITQYLEGSPMWEQAIKAFGKNTVPADVAIIYALAKILDPQSVVREGELLLFTKGNAVGELMKGYYNATFGGTAKLTPDLRLKLYDMGKNTMDSRFAAAAPFQRVYETEALQRRIDPRSVIPPLKPPGTIRPQDISKQNIDMPGTPAAKKSILDEADAL